MWCLRCALLHDLRRAGRETYHYQECRFFWRVATEFCSLCGILWNQCWSMLDSQMEIAFARIFANERRHFEVRGVYDLLVLVHGADKTLHSV